MTENKTLAIRKKFTINFFILQLWHWLTNMLAIFLNAITYLFVSILFLLLPVNLRFKKKLGEIFVRIILSWSLIKCWFLKSLYVEMKLMCLDLSLCFSSKAWPRITKGQILGGLCWPKRLGLVSICLFSCCCCCFFFFFFLSFGLFCFDLTFVCVYVALSFFLFVSNFYLYSS